MPPPAPFVVLAKNAPKSPMDLALPLPAITHAARLIAPLARQTPLLTAAALDAQAGARLLLKAENLQTGGSFKIRGATHALAQLSPAARARGVAAFSSGNHAIAVALAAQHFGIRAVIVMPADAPATKRARTAQAGAEIVLYDRVTGDREAIAAELAARDGLTIIKPFDARDTITGQATVGLELAAQAKAHGQALDGVAVCCGGGGLAAGVGAALATLSPATKIWAVEPAAFDDTRQSVAAGERVQLDLRGRTSICDALLAPTPGKLTFAFNRRQLTGVAGVTDDEVRAAMRAAWEHLHLALEPGGAVALAAALTGKLPLEGQTWGITLSGGNVDLPFFAATVQPQSTPEARRFSP